MAGVLAGWSQGDFVPITAHVELGLPTDGSLRAIVTPYACVMAQADPSTAIDLLLVRPSKKNEGNFFGRSLKTINLLALCGEVEHYFDATPIDRRIISAKYLIGHRHDASLRLEDAHREGLSYWLAQRFLRNALPDDFNEAWEPARKGLRKLAKRMGACRIVLLTQRTTTARKYAIELLLVLDPRAIHKLDELRSVAIDMEKLFLACDRIESVHAEVRPIEAVSLRDFWEWTHFDAFDDISMGPGHAGPANHAHGAADPLTRATPWRLRLRWIWGILRDEQRR